MLIYLLIVAFILGYGLIVCEHNIGINKAAAALLTAVVCWGLYLSSGMHTAEEEQFQLKYYLADASSITFFLLGAMTIVELIDSHKGFQIVTQWLHVRSLRKLLWTIGLISFFLSAILDNLTSCIIMVSLLRKIVKDQTQRWLIGGLVVIAVNAGGAWTPIGDVTTTMLWIKGNISTSGVMLALFLPSLVCLLVSISGISFLMKHNTKAIVAPPKSPVEPGASLVFILGLLSLLMVPLFKELFELPPYLGILFGVGVLWCVTDILHARQEKGRSHLRIPHALARIDISSVLFFLGILLAISALDASHILRDLAVWVGEAIKIQSLVSLIIGLVSAIVDNVPLVAAAMGMYDFTHFPPDHSFWKLLAYCAGTGGSILIIGSAAGVAFMGLEKVNFIWYFKKISLLALVAYLAGFFTYLALSPLLP